MYTSIYCIITVLTYSYGYDTFPELLIYVQAVDFSGHSRTHMQHITQHPKGS